MSFNLVIASCHRTFIGRVLIGTSGFSYPHWGKGVFYPPYLKPQDWLAYYSHYLDTVEINSSI